VAVGLEETPISDDQTIADDRDDPDWCVLRATVPDTSAVRTWIRGHGAMAEVLGPKSLRREIAQEAIEAAERYRADFE
jgi:predicted DNA-binding transcriptional regulator YafY